MKHSSLLVIIRENTRMPFPRLNWLNWLTGWCGWLLYELWFRHLSCIYGYNATVHRLVSIAFLFISNQFQSPLCYDLWMVSDCGQVNQINIMCHFTCAAQFSYFAISNCVPRIKLYLKECVLLLDIMQQWQSNNSFYHLRNCYAFQ